MGVTLIFGPAGLPIGPDPASLKCVEDILHQTSADGAYFLPSTLEALCRSPQSMKCLSKLKLIGYGGGEYTSIKPTTRDSAEMKKILQAPSHRQPAMPSSRTAQTQPFTTASAVPTAAPSSPTSPTAKTGNTSATALITTGSTGDRQPKAYTKWSSCGTRGSKCTRAPSPRTRRCRNGRRGTCIPSTRPKPTTGATKLA